MAKCLKNTDNPGPYQVAKIKYPPLTPPPPPISMLLLTRCFSAHRRTLILGVGGRRRVICTLKKMIFLIFATNFVWDCSK